MSDLTIKNAGRMWRVYCGSIVLAFASTYPLASARADELKASGAVERALQRRAARKVN